MYMISKFAWKSLHDSMYSLIYVHLSGANMVKFITSYNIHWVHMRIRKTAMLNVKVQRRKSVKTCRHVKHASNPILTKINQNPLKYLDPFWTIKIFYIFTFTFILPLFIKHLKMGSDRMENFFDHNLDKNTDTKSEIIVIWGKCKRTYVYLTLSLFLFSSQGKVNVYWEELCIT